VGKRAFLDLLPLTIGLPQQVCGRRGAIGNAIHVHASRESCFAGSRQAQTENYMGTKYAFPGQSDSLSMTYETTVGQLPTSSCSRGRATQYLVDVYPWHAAPAAV